MSKSTWANGDVDELQGELHLIADEYEKNAKQKGISKEDKRKLQLIGAAVRFAAEDVTMLCYKNRP